MTRHRSLQKGKSLALLATGFLQIGHFSCALRFLGTTQL
jgi:hypothetical protein